MHDLQQHWPTYGAYLISFATLAIIWIEHHGMMGAVTAIDRRFLERTLVFLLFVSIIPWPTALAADYVDARSHDARTAAILYAATMLMMGLSFAWSWRYLRTHPDLVAASARPAFAAGTRRALVGSLVYVVAIVAALVSPLASFALDAAVALYFAVSRSDVPGLIITSSPHD